MDVQTDIGHVVNVFAGDKPDDLTDFAFRPMTRQPCERVGIDLFRRRQFRRIVQRRAFRFGKERTRPVILQRIELRFVHGRLDHDRPANVHTEQADVEPRDLLANEHHHLWRQRELFVQRSDL